WRGGGWRGGWHGGGWRGGWHGGGWRGGWHGNRWRGGWGHRRWYGPGWGFVGAPWAYGGFYGGGPCGYGFRWSYRWGCVSPYRWGYCATNAPMPLLAEGHGPPPPEPDHAIGYSGAPFPSS